MLVEYGAKEVEKMGLDTFVLAFKAGLNIYKRTGFKQVEELIQDDTPYGGPGNYGAYFLVKDLEINV